MRFGVRAPRGDAVSLESLMNQVYQTQMCNYVLTHIIPVIQTHRRSCRKDERKAQKDNELQEAGEETEGERSHFIQCAKLVTWKDCKV